MSYDESRFNFSESVLTTGKIVMKDDKRLKRIAKITTERYKKRFANLFAVS